MGRSPLLDAHDSLVLIVDMQTSLMPYILRAEELVHTQRKLVGVAQRLGVPVLVTEHYKKGLGATAPEVVDLLGGEPEGNAESSYRPIQKISFSCMGEESFLEALEQYNRKRLVIAGIETHICVCQTALEAAAAGFDVHVVPDAVSARHETGHHYGLEKLKRFRVELDTWEMIAYQWLRRAGTPEFKACLPFFKEA